MELISRDFWWPQMWKTIKDFVLSCDICSRSKNPRHRPYGLLQPLPIPKRPWSSISMDFIVDLPPSNSYDSILVVVDRLTKMAHFVPCKKTASSEDTARLFLRIYIATMAYRMMLFLTEGPSLYQSFEELSLEY